jgi:ADP-ribosylation factor-like protein 8
LVARAGLQNAGKTSFVDALGGGQFTEDMIPTVGFNMRKLKRDGVGVKTWDLGGQERFRGTWERYCRGMNCVVFVVDATAPELFESAKNELHGLLKRETLKEIPLLVLGNKSDVPGAVKVNEVIEAMELKRATGREVCCYNVSCKNSTNIDVCLKWLISHAP